MEWAGVDYRLGLICSLRREAPESLESVWQSDSFRLRFVTGRVLTPTASNHL